MLSGPEIFVWTEAFFKAFSRREFSDVLLFRLDDRVEAYAASVSSSKEAIADVIDAYQRADIEDKLIAAALEARPRNATLLRLANQKHATVEYNDQELQDFVRKNNKFLELSVWLDKLGALHVRVCRIEIQGDTGRVFGTGFLVGPDLVMTNWHVVRSILAREEANASYSGPRATPKDLVCRFDYKKLANGTTNEGNVFGLADDWNVFLSPNSSEGHEPAGGDLDISILRLKDPAGSFPVGKGGARGDVRGWIPIPSDVGEQSYRRDAPLAIIQHPSGSPLKLALDTQSIQEMNKNANRLRYSTNSAPGSSGSPCFDIDWNLIAVHHSGDPNFSHPSPVYNEGIPANAIQKQLVAKGVNLPPSAE